MFRTITYLAAAALLTTGAVAAMAAPTGDEVFKVTINKTGDYCIHAPAITGSLIPKVECRSVQSWARDGVTFQQR
jgi:hypothetical protein